VGFVVDKVALGQVSSEYFGFPYKSSFLILLHTYHHLSSGAGTIDRLVADVPSGLKSHPITRKQTKLKKTTETVKEITQAQKCTWNMRKAFSKGTHNGGFMYWTSLSRLELERNSVRISAGTPDIAIEVLFLFYFSHGLRLSPFGTSDTIWPIVPGPDDR
jgi:hypothetical protein